MKFQFCAFAIFVPLALSAQTVTLDWETGKITAGKDMVLDKPTKIHVQLLNANTFLYDYEITAVPVRVVYDDFSLFPSLAAAAAADKCAVAVTDLGTVTDPLNQKIKAFRDAVCTGDCKTPKSIKYAVSKTTYTSDIQPLALKLPAKEQAIKDSCTAANADLVLQAADYLRAKARLQRYSDAANGLIIPGVDATVGPGFGLQVDAKEMYTPDSGTPTPTGKTASDSIADVGRPVLFLSAGFLLTKIADRGYSAADVPGSTTKVLNVQSNGWPRTLGLALLNYSVPLLDPQMEKANLGLSLAVGPTIQLSSGKTDISNLGFFTGISLDFWKRIFITPGIHIGQFADFPQGFGSRGDAIPANFGTLNPQKRTTARFGISITVRAKSFDNLFTAKSKAAGAAAQN